MLAIAYVLLKFQKERNFEKKERFEEITKS